MAGVTVLVAAGSRGRVRSWPQAWVRPVDLGDYGSRAPAEVFAAGLDEEVVAGVFAVESVGEVETGRSFADQGLVPWPPTVCDLALGGVEGDGGGAEVPVGPGPLGLGQPQQVQEVRRCVRGAGGEPPRHLVHLGQQAG